VSARPAGSTTAMIDSPPGVCRPHWFRAAVLTAVAYFAAGLLALDGFPLDGGLAGIWPAAGVAVAGVLIAGPLAALGVFAGDFLVELQAGFVPSSALALALGTVVESLVAWLLLTRVRPIDLHLARIRDVTRFIALGAVPAAVLCVASRLFVLAVIGQGGLPTADQSMGLLVGFLGHGLGVMIVAPVILTWYMRHAAPQHVFEFASLLLTAVVLNAGAFTATPIAPGSAPLYAIFAVVLWAALRFGPRETSTVMLVTSGFATWSASSGSGPFLVASQSDALFSLSQFLLVVAATALFLAAAVCERQRYLRRVAESEQAHRTLIEQMAEGVVTLDAHGRLNYVSERFCAILGQARSRLLGLPLTDVVVAGERAALCAALETCTAARDVTREVALQTGAGIPLRVSVAMRRLGDTPRRPAGIMAVVADITERRRAEELAQLHLQQLAHLGRVKSMDEMATAFAHEVAQPLTAITSYAQAAQRFLRAGRAADPALAEALEGAYNEARRASVIVQRIRGFVQDRAAQMVELPVESLIGEALHLSAPEAHQHAVDLHAGACPGDCSVRADLVQIQQVLLNLVRNAIEALAGSAVAQRCVSLNAYAREEGLIEFAVADNGPGIPAENLERIFDPFFTTKSEGAGIGLALCHSIVEAHGGRLWAESLAGSGAVFHFTLKAANHE